MSNGKVPKLRFPEFRDAGEWEEKNLEAICKIQRGKFSHRPRNDPRFFGGKYQFIQTGDVVKSNGGSVQASQTLNEQGLGVSKLFKPPVVLITIAANIGDTGLLNREACFTDSVAGLIPNNGVCAVFLELAVRGKKEYLNKIAPAAAQKNINNEILSVLPILIPEFVEQQKIADCLSSLDELITAQAQKVAALKAHKKGLMQQLFPRDGETVPKLRFPEFRDAGEWEVKKLCSMVQLISGLHLSPEQYSNKGKTPYFTGPSDFTNRIQIASKWTEESTSIAIEKDILITVKGSGVGEIWHLTLPQVAMGRQLMAIRSTSSSSLFIFQLLLTKRSRFEDLASGNLIPGLSRGDILELEATFPSLPEQQKIADCLSSIDELITAQAQKVEALKAHKKGLMQQLFPSADEAHP